VYSSGVDIMSMTFEYYGSGISAVTSSTTSKMLQRRSNRTMTMTAAIVVAQIVSW
jgi:hypothetical protein